MKGILIYYLVLLLFARVNCVEDTPKDSKQIKDCKAKCVTLYGEKRTNCEEQCHDDDVQMNGMVVLYAVLITIPLILFIGLIFYYYRKRMAKFLGIKLPREELKQHFISSIGTLDNKELKQIRQELKENHWEIIKQSEVQQEEGIDLNIWAELSNHKGILNVKMIGTDKVGQWNSKGIVVKDINGIQYFWMLVDYVNKKKAGQIDNLKYLIYRAERSPDSNYFLGKWYFNGFENHEIYSGKLIMKRVDQLKIS